MGSTCSHCGKKGTMKAVPAEQQGKGSDHEVYSRSPMDSDHYVWRFKWSAHVCANCNYATLTYYGTEYTPTMWPGISLGLWPDALCAYPYTYECVSCPHRPLSDSLEQAKRFHETSLCEKIEYGQDGWAEMPAEYRHLYECTHVRLPVVCKACWLRRPSKQQVHVYILLRKHMPLAVSGSVTSSSGAAVGHMSKNTVSRRGLPKPAADLIYRMGGFAQCDRDPKAVCLEKGGWGGGRGVGGVSFHVNWRHSTHALKGEYNYGSPTDARTAS